MARRLPTNEYDQAIRESRHRLYGRVVVYIGWALIVAASAIPFNAIERSVRDLAGKNTSVNFIATITVTVSVGLTLLAGEQLRRLRKQGTELERLRARLAAFEEMALEQQQIRRRKKK